jgi:hypothetical protein
VGALFKSEIVSSNYKRARSILKFSKLEKKALTTLAEIQRAERLFQSIA